MASKYQPDNDLRGMAVTITAAIDKNKDGTDQKVQVERLMLLEERFRKSLIPFRQSREMYRKFILLVAVKNKNILSARPFFREKSKKFSTEITPAIKNGNVKALQSFHLNYNLAKFIRTNWLGDFPQKSEKIYNQLVEARRILIENNMPLAINRAKLFYRKVPQSHITLMDMIGIAGMGLISGVDKWVGSYTTVFNGVAIGRMVGNLIDQYSETTLHFYPSDRSLLYRANSIRYRQDIQDLTELADAINKSYEEDRQKGIKVPVKTKVTADQLADLLNASSPLSTEISFGSDSESDASSEVPKNMLDYRVDDDVESQEETTIKNDLILKMSAAARELPLIQQKILRLKGIKI